MQPGEPGLPPNTSRGTTMSEGTPSTPDEGRAHAVPSFAARETAAVPGTAPHDERQKKQQTRHSGGATSCARSGATPAILRPGRPGRKGGRGPSACPESLQQDGD